MYYEKRNSKLTEHFFKTYGEGVDYPAHIHHSFELIVLLENELTERQRVCASDFWLNGKKQKEIARELGLSQSTVCRHIAAAKRKLRHAAKYSPATASAFGCF